VEGTSVHAGESRLWDLGLARLVEHLIVRRNLKEISFFSSRASRASVLSRQPSQRSQLSIKMQAGGRRPSKC
jgi:hypothetical protein